MNPRSALDRLIGALEAFHLAASTAQDPSAPSVAEAADALADAYIVYDDVVFTGYGVEAPLDVYGDDDDYDEDFDDDYDDFDMDDEDDADLDDDLEEDEDFDDDLEDEDDLEDDEEIDDDTLEDEEGLDDDADFDDGDYEEDPEDGSGG